MFSSSVAGGSICLGCQLRAVTRRAAAPIGSTAAQTRIRNRKRRYYASRAVRPQEDDGFAALEEDRHVESNNSSYRTYTDDWALGEDKKQDASNGLGRGGQEGRLGPYESTHTSHDQAEPTRLEDFIKETIANQVYSDDTSKTSHSQVESAQQRIGSEQQVVRRIADGVDWSEQYRPKTYWKGDTKLVEDFRKLTVDTLGREADIIVLKDAGEYKKKKPAKVDRRSFRENSGLKDFADQEPGLSMDTIMENIEEFRPDIRIMPAGEFKVLFDKLMSAFTSLQIGEYVTRYQQRVMLGEESPFSGSLPGLGSTRPWIVSEMRWIPEVRGAMPNIEPTLQGYILKSMPLKQRRVMEVMRQCWGMSVQELTSGLGALEITVRDLEFKLLTLGNQRWLQQITRIYLGQGKGKSISVVKSRNILRIEAPKAIAETCLNAIDKTLQKIRSKTFSMDVITFANLDYGAVEELGRLTNSVLRLDSKRNEIEVTWIDYQDRSASKLEDLGDTVFRLLLTGNPPSNVEHSLRIFPHVPGQARLVEELGSSEKLPWMHRRMRWARVYLPASSPSTLLEEAWSSKDGILEYEVVSTPQDFVLPESSIVAKMYGSRSPRWEEVGDLVASRKGATVSPLAPPRQKAVSAIPTEEGHTEDPNLQLVREHPTSPEPDALVEGRTKPQVSQEPDVTKASLEANASAEEQAELESQQTEKLQTSLALGKPEGEQALLPGYQAPEESEMSEELQSSSEPQVLEGAELQEPQAEELKVSEDPQTAVDPVSTSEERLEDKQSVFEALEKPEKSLSSGPTPPPRWSPFRVRTNAVFGHVLHLFQPDWTHSTNKAVATIKALASSPRAISPLIPPVAKMDLKGWVPYNIPSNMSAMVVMRFVPSNDDDVNTDASSDEQYQMNPAPLLELRMKASDEDIIEIDSLRAVARTQVSDFLFPSEGVDVRTTQRLEAELPGSMVESMDGMSPLVTFLTNSKLEVREGKLLTPPRITKLGLPQWMFRDHHHEFVAHKKSLAANKSSSESAKTNKKGQRGQDLKEQEQHNEESEREEAAAPLRPTSYVFAGLEVHRTLETVYDGWKLAYTSIEAGQGGGRRAELSLEAKPGYDRDFRRTAEQINSQEFLQSVYTLVRGLPGKLVQTRKPDNQKMRTTIEWLGAGKKGM